MSLLWNIFLDKNHIDDPILNKCPHIRILETTIKFEVEVKDSLPTKDSWAFDDDVLRNVKFTLYCLFRDYETITFPEEGKSFQSGLKCEGLLSTLQTHTTLLSAMIFYFHFRIRMIRSFLNFLNWIYPIISDLFILDLFEFIKYTWWVLIYESPNENFLLNPYFQLNSPYR